MPNTPPWNHPVNAPTPVNGPITLMPYDERWPHLFELERARILGAIGERALCIEQIGSTSVAGLAAKPINDIVLVVENFAAEDDYLGDLEAAGFILRIREPVEDHDSSFRGVEPHRVFKGPEIDPNLHVWSRDSAEIDRHRSFREWVLSHPDDRAMYERMKLELAAQHWDNVQQYADAKTVVIDEIRAKSDRSR